MLKHSLFYFILFFDFQVAFYFFTEAVRRRRAWQLKKMPLVYSLCTYIPSSNAFVFLKTLNLHLEEIDNNRSAQRPQLIFCPDLAYTGNSSVFLIYFSLFFYYFFFFCFLSFSVTELLLVLATVEPLYKGQLGNRRNWPL